MKKFNKKLLSFFFLILFLFLTHTAFAASLNLSPSSGSYNVGDSIKVRIILSSSDQSANAVSGTISFSKDLLTLNSISKTGSIISLWPTDPSYSNSSGTANIEGIILSGYQGASGTVATLSFKVKVAGNASIKFTSSSVLANDGQGTNILSGTGQASFNLSPLKTETPITAPASKTTPVPIPPAPEVTAPTVVKVSTPVFTDYSKDIQEGEFLVVKGTADPLTDILITSDKVAVSTEQVVRQSATVKSDENGMFTYVLDKAESGIYMITAQAQNQDGVESETALPVKISVSSPSLPTNSISTNIMNTFSILIPIMALIILLILLMIWGWHHILRYREYTRKRLMEARTIVSKSFNILDEDVAEEVKIFKKFKALEPLTKDERLFINQFKKDIEAAEKTILNEIKE